MNYSLMVAQDDENAKKYVFKKNKQIFHEFYIEKNIKNYPHRIES